MFFLGRNVPGARFPRGGNIREGRNLLRGGGISGGIFPRGGVFREIFSKG